MPDIITVSRWEKAAGNHHGHYAVRQVQGSAHYDAEAVWVKIPTEDLASFKGKRNSR
jgi:hypothetical protein